jgi:phenylalanyl-tRNA synthetase beta chain
VRRANPGEKLTTLDGASRALDPDDLVVTDDSGVIALAGVMGGASTEIDRDTTDIVLEAAHWQPSSIAFTARRHKLPSEASRRFERGVDPEIAGVALRRCTDLLVEHGGARAVEGYTVVGAPATRPRITLGSSLPESTAGMPIPREEVVTFLEAVGCVVEGADVLHVQAPTWRSDLRDPADLVEEVVRLVGYDKLPSVLPAPIAGAGLTAAQALRRSTGRVLAALGFLEVLTHPFVSPAMHDAFGLAPDDPRRHALRLANPLADTEPELRTSLLPGLFSTLLRNLGRGNRDVAIFEDGLVFHTDLSAPKVPRPGVDARPDEAELDALFAAIPPQPRHVAAVLCGAVERPGWWGGGRTATWADAIETARVVARTARAELVVRPAQFAPWHPGRCAELALGDRVIGHAGEVHPRVVAALGLPERTCAMELDLDAIEPPGPARAPHLSMFPPVLLDVALVVSADVAAADVLAAVQAGAGELLEAVRLFDVYSDESRLGAGFKSLAFALRFRAPDRTLTVDEATAARDAAIARAGTDTGAVLRS